MYCIHIIFIVILFWKSNLTVNLVPTATHRGRVAARAPAALDASPGDLNPSTRSAGDAFAGAMIFGAGEILMKVVKAGLKLPRDDSGKRLFIADFWFKDGGWNCLSHHLIFQWLWLWTETSLGYPQFLGSCAFLFLVDVYFKQVLWRLFWRTSKKYFSFWEGAGSKSQNCLLALLNIWMVKYWW